MRGAFILSLVLLAFGAAAQKTDTFAIRKTPAVRNKALMDTFVQQTFLSDKIDRLDHIIYRTGLKILSSKSLIFFRATQSILDSLGVMEEKNASIGEYRKVPYAIIMDTLFFIVKYQLPSMKRPGRQVEVTKSYKGLKGTKTMLMEVNTVADPPESAPKTEQETYSLFREELLLTRRK